MIRCTCAECGITKTKFVPSQAGGDLLDCAVGTATDLFVEHVLPYLAEKSVEMASYYGSEALRNKNWRKKAINYGPKKLTPVIQNVGSQALDKLSTKIRPKKMSRTKRSDLGDQSPSQKSGNMKEVLIQLAETINSPKKVSAYQAELANYAWEQARIFVYRRAEQFLSALNLRHIFQQIGTGIIDKAKEKGSKELTSGGVAGGPSRVDYKKGWELLKDPGLWKIPNKQEIADMKKHVAALKGSYHAVQTLGFKGSYTSFAKKIGAVQKPSYTFPGFGSGIYVHKAIGKLPKPKAGWTLPGNRYTGPYNDLENQVGYNPKTGEISEIYDQPF